MAENSASSPATPIPAVTALTGNNVSLQYASLVSINAATLIPIKLSRGGNYASWRSQFSNLLFGYDLMGYVEGTYPCPAETMVKTGETTESVNPDRKIWLCQDRLVLQAIQASLAGNIALLISSCQTSADAWSKLETTFANKSHIRMLTLLSTLMKVVTMALTQYCRVPLLLRMPTT
ncbi:unnamed protein product [Fraxinus pennsylvanica]|uniref:Retrotransposon Copia-like N-terminal domain-containing protein n=1 Tax=Fraxinus pennsylvanica TaxID=56036 RepID=A0AAD2EAQ9_9LAMI|nr:unnamed protein product [Fraxinus pennsylvanica]